MSDPSPKWTTGLGLAIVIVAFLAYTGFQMFGGESVAEYRTKVIQGIDAGLASPESGVRKRIEAAHLTVKSTGARVTACDVKTMDGSQNAGKNGSNVSEVDFVVTVFWEGFFQKEGFTEIRMVWDHKQQKVKSTTYVGGNAAFNKDTIEWVKVGQELAPIVLSIVATL